jgi:rSAM/selenodomain-associated transferase 2
MKLSVIIPVLNESQVLSQTLEALLAHAGSPEIIVVDGCSTDNSAETARKYTSRVLLCPRGRGIQQDTGARQAQGDVLLFLHGDTRLPFGFEEHIRQALCDPKVVFGAFVLAIDPPSPILKLISLTANLRSMVLKMPYGDQALFMRRSAYLRAGGFRLWPVMEDVDLVRRLHGIGDFKLIREPVHTSARRWEKETPVRTTLRNWSLMIRYFLGASPQTLVRHYPDTR